MVKKIGSSSRSFGKQKTQDYAALKSEIGGKYEI